LIRFNLQRNFYFTHFFIFFSYFSAMLGTNKEGGFDMKQFFQNHRIFIVVVIAVAILCGGVVGAAVALRHDAGVFPNRVNAGNTTMNQNQTQDAGSPIEESTALQIALEHAGLQESDVTVLKNKLDRDDGVYEYDVEFLADGKKYDYTINAQSGDIRSYEIEANTIAGTADSNVIAEDAGSDAALQAALDHAGLQSSDVTVVKNHLDRDDGVYQYEIEFLTDTKEYDYTVSVDASQIYSYSISALPQTSSSAPSGSNAGTGEVLSEDAVVQIALEYAGLAQEDVTRQKCELDRDDGQTIYELEFLSGGMEYEFEIDAFSGAVLSFQTDRHD
jgi:uncharacterized membrane protein YkoI